MTADIIGTGVALPLGVDRRGTLALAHGEEDVAQAISIILSTAPGQRPMRPEFGCGLHDYVFDVLDAATLGSMEAEIRRALERWEPRIERRGRGLRSRRRARAACWRSPSPTACARSNDVRNLVYPFYVVAADEDG